MSHEINSKKGLGPVMSGIILPSYVGIIINHYEVAYQTTSKPRFVGLNLGKHSPPRVAQTFEVRSGREKH